MLHSSATMLSERIFDLSPNACKVLLFIVDNRGELTISGRALAKAVGMTHKQVRTAIGSLIKKGLMAQYVAQPSAQCQPISTFCITDSYADVLMMVWHNKGHNERHTVEKEKTNEKENSPLIYPPYKEKENKKEKELLLLTPSQSSGEKKQLTLDKIEQLRNEVETSQIKIEQYCKLLGLDRITFIRLANEVLDEWLINEDIDITWKHLTNHMRVKLRNEQRQPVSRQEKRDRWRQQLAAISQEAITNLQNSKT